MSEVAAAAVEVAAAYSTLSWRGLRDLLFAPRRFFSRGIGLAKRPEVTFVAWIVGVALAFDRLDRIKVLTTTWLGAWIFALMGGMFIGGLRWYIAGWFYGKRLEWSGAIEPDEEVARSVNASQDFVMSAPQVLWAIVATFVYPDYATATGDIAAGALLIVFVFWSCLTSYVGATTAFPRVSRGRAAIWFIVVPMLFYTIGFVVAAI